MIILRSAGCTGHPRRQEWRSWSGETGVTLAVNACDVPGEDAPGEGVGDGDAAAVVMATAVTPIRTSAVAAGLRYGMNAISPG